MYAQKSIVTNDTTHRNEHIPTDRFDLLRRDIL